MEKTKVTSPKVLQPAAPFSQAITARGRTLMFISGQIALDAKGNLVGKGDVRAQLKRIFENIKALLEAQGATLDQVVKLTTFLTDADSYPIFNEVRGEYLKGVYPASTAVIVKGLVNNEWLAEVEAIAIVD